MFQKTAKTTTNAGDYPANVPKNGQNARADNALATKLALEVPRTSNLSKLGRIKKLQARNTLEAWLIRG